ncbi:MAG: hypothetical protein WCJ25_04410, partial [Candidatus Moraniibacteriota bacterium]
LVETGGLVITVVDPKAATIGKATLYPVATDTDGDGNDDYTGLPMADQSVKDRDGKTVTIDTTAVSDTSRIFVTPDVPEPIAVSARKSGKSFTVSVKDPVSDPIIFDWTIIEEK